MEILISLTMSVVAYFSGFGYLIPIFIILGMSSARQ
jgi:hypothetical protein